MSDLFLRTPEFSSGCPIGRRQAIFGISSTSQGCGTSNTHTKEIAASSKSKCFLIEPPRAQAPTADWNRTLLTATFPGGILSGTGLPVFIEADVVRWEVRKDCSAQFENVHRSQIFVKNFAVGSDQDGIGNRRIPGRVERRLQGCGVIRSKQKVTTGGVFFLKHPHHAWFFVRHVGRDGDQIEIANLVHLESFLKVGELVDARAAPGGPGTD